MTRVLGRSGLTFWGREHGKWSYRKGKVTQKWRGEREMREGFGLTVRTGEGRSNSIHIYSVSGVIGFWKTRV